MSACEKCWGDAYTRALFSGRDQVDVYRELIAESSADSCTPEERAGQFWDAELQRDIRFPVEEGVTR
jgi:hypothetical protein